MKTALEAWLSTEPEDIDAPERRPHETTMEYHRRWWFHWSTRDAKKSRESWGKGVVKR